MNEIVRRAALLVGAVVAAVLFCLNSGPLVHVEVERHVDSDRQTPIRKSGADWEAAVDRVTAPGWSADGEYFSPDVRPFSDILPELAESNLATALVQVDAPGGRVLLSITPLDPRGVLRSAPTAIAYPLRWLSYWVLGTAALVYLAIRWPPRLGSDVFQYSRLEAGILPDLFVALPLVLLFVALPMLICRQFGSGSVWEMFSIREGTAFFTLLMWGLAALGASIWWITAWYSAYAFAVRHEGIWVKTLSGEREYPFDTIVAVEPSRVGLPDWGRKLLWLAPLISWRALPSVLISETADLRAVDLVLQDGSRVRLPLGGFRKIDQLLDDLRARAGGQPLTPAEQLTALDETPRPSPRSAWVECARRVLLLTGVGAASWAYFQTTPELLQVRPTTYELERSRLADFFFANGFKSLDEYLAHVAKQDASRVTHVAGAEWDHLFADIQEGIAARKQHIGTRSQPDLTLSYRHSEAPAVLRAWSAGIERSESPRFAVLGTGAERRYLAVSYVDGLEVAYRDTIAVPQPPVEILHPLRRWTWLTLLASFLMYAAISWPRQTAKWIIPGPGLAIFEDLCACLCLAATVAWTVAVASPYASDMSDLFLEDWLLVLGVPGLGTALILALAADAVRRAAKRGKLPATRHRQKSHGKVTAEIKANSP